MQGLQGYEIQEEQHPFIRIMTGLFLTIDGTLFRNGCETAYTKALHELNAIET
jgi:hypothetical protein